VGGDCVDVMVSGSLFCCWAVGCVGGVCVKLVGLKNCAGSMGRRNLGTERLQVDRLNCGLFFNARSTWIICVGRIMQVRPCPRAAGVDAACHAPLVGYEVRAPRGLAKRVDVLAGDKCRWWVARCFWT
jgi:hypothetical protein